MMLPGAIAIVSPLVIGFALGPEALGGFLAGATVSGVLLGMFMNNAGGAWDNAKKSFEKGVDINGEMFYKGSEPHKASVTGDTVGDPFKDTSGPSMNILIKLMSIVSLIIAPHIAINHGAGMDDCCKGKAKTACAMPGGHMKECTMHANACDSVCMSKCKAKGMECTKMSDGKIECSEACKNLYREK